MTFIAICVGNSLQMVMVSMLALITFLLLNYSSGHMACVYWNFDLKAGVMWRKLDLLCWIDEPLFPSVFALVVLSRFHHSAYVIANVWFHFDLRADVAGMGLKNWPFMNANLFEVALALMFWIQFQSHALRLVCPGRSFRLKMEVIWKQRNSDSLRDGFPFTFYLPWWCSIDSRIMFQGRQMFVRIWIRRRKLLESSSTRGIALCEFFSRFVCPFGVETIPWTCFKDWKSLLEFPFEDKFSCRWRLCICSLLSLRSFAWAGDLESVPNRSFGDCKSLPNFDSKTEFARVWSKEGNLGWHGDPRWLEAIWYLRFKSVSRFVNVILFC